MMFIRLKTNHKCFHGNNNKSIQYISWNEIFGDNGYIWNYIFPINPSYKDKNIIYGYKISEESLNNTINREFSAYL